MVVLDLWQELLTREDQGDTSAVWQEAARGGVLMARLMMAAQNTRSKSGRRVSGVVLCKFTY